MADNIVARLREESDFSAFLARNALRDATVCEEAASEIERLQKELLEATRLLEVTQKHHYDREQTIAKLQDIIASSNRNA